MNNEVEKEKYLGSVRFFKHVILSCLGAAILIPLCLCIYLGIRDYSLRKQNERFAHDIEVLRQTLANLETKEPAITGDWEDWQILLVNDTHPLPRNFSVSLVPFTRSQKVDSRIYEPLDQMLNAMRQEGLSPLVCSGYRSFERQLELFTDHIKSNIQYGMEYDDAFYQAKRELALPGASEHHTGLSVDIVAQRYQSLDKKQADTDEAIWLAQHCQEYGFILRYPEGKTDITGIEYESWHFRYVGKDAATYIMENKLTLEEFLALIGEE